MKEPKFKRLSEHKCSFCNQKLEKDKIYKVRDSKNNYVICGRCNEKINQYQKEYNERSAKIQKKYQNRVEQLSMELRKKYKLKMHY